MEIHSMVEKTWIFRPEKLHRKEYMETTWIFWPAKLRRKKYVETTKIFRPVKLRRKKYMETTWKFVEIWSSTYRSNIDVESTWIRRGVPVWFLVDAHRFGVAFPKLQTFSEIFWALHIDYSQYKKMILRIFFICSFMKLQRQKFLETVHSSRNTSYLRTTHFCAKC